MSDKFFPKCWNLAVTRADVLPAFMMHMNSVEEADYTQKHQTQAHDRIMILGKCKVSVRSIIKVLM